MFIAVLFRKHIFIRKFRAYEVAGPARRDDVKSCFLRDESGLTRINGMHVLLLQIIVVGWIN